MAARVNHTLVIGSGSGSVLPGARLGKRPLPEPSTADAPAGKRPKLSPHSSAVAIPVANGPSTSSKSRTCPTCGQVFTKAELQTHVQVHKTRGVFKCDFPKCVDRTFHMQGALLSHQQMVHGFDGPKQKGGVHRQPQASQPDPSPEPGETVKETRRRLHRCTFTGCEEAFKDPRRLELHFERGHMHPDRPHPCVRRECCNMLFWPRTFCQDIHVQGYISPADVMPVVAGSETADTRSKQLLSAADEEQKPLSDMAPMFEQPSAERSVEVKIEPFNQLGSTMDVKMEPLEESGWNVGVKAEPVESALTSDPESDAVDCRSNLLRLLALTSSH